MKSTVCKLLSYLKYFALLFIVLPQNKITYSETIAEVNSNVYFKPKLDYFSKEKTGLSVLVIHKENEVTINNPFFSKSGYYIEKHKGFNKYELHSSGKIFRPNHHGKINLTPFPKGKHNLKISWESDSIHLSPNIKDKHISLHLLMLPQNGFSSILGEYQTKSVLNLGYKKLYTTLTTLKTIILKIQSDSFVIKDFVDTSYRDDLGKAKDFIAYLNIQYSKLDQLDIKLIKVKLLDKTYIVDLKGDIKFSKSPLTNFDYRFHLNHDFQIKSYKSLTKLDTN